MVLGGLDDRSTSPGFPFWASMAPAGCGMSALVKLTLASISHLTAVFMEGRGADAAPGLLADAQITRWCRGLKQSPCECAGWPPTRSIVRPCRVAPSRQVHRSRFESRRTPRA
jgi:hypothetical protein